jgi:hypothetical protein
MASPAFKDDKTGPPTHLEPSHTRVDDVNDVNDAHSVQRGDLLDLESVDPVLNAKMRLVNDAIDEIGFTGYQAKLFVLSGFGYVSTFFLSASGHGRVAGYMLYARLRDLLSSFHFKIAAGVVQSVTFAEVA